MKITLTKEDQKFIKVNKGYLSDMFLRWINGMKNEVFEMSVKTEAEKLERDRYIDVIKIFESVLLGMKMVEIKNKKETNFI